jgi:hypothetical protein
MISRTAGTCAGMLIAIGGLLGNAVQTQTAQASEPNRAKVFASLPDWTGIWESEAWSTIDVSGRPVGGAAAVRAKSALAAHPPYNAEWEARYQAALKSFDAQKHADTMKVCEFGFPGVLESPAVFQILVTPEQTVFLYATREARHVHTDGREQPDAESLWPTLLGHSVGRWERRELVIDTVSRLATAPLRFTAPLIKLSDQARFTERLRLIAPDRLENEMTVEDPVALERPWHLKLVYRRVSNLDRMIYHNCTENDRNPVIDGRMTIAPGTP